MLPERERRRIPESGRDSPLLRPGRTLQCYCDFLMSHVYPLDRCWRSFLENDTLGRNVPSAGDWGCQEMYDHCC
jgi:hypothetical protein